MHELIVLLIGTLATWRITALLCYDKITDGMRRHFGAGLLKDDDSGRPFTFIGGILDCFWCTSLLVSVPVAALAMLSTALCPVMVLYPFVLSGGAILLGYATRVAIAVER